MPAIYFERDGSAWDAPINGRPTTLSRFFANVADGATLEFFGGRMQAGRRFRSEALSTANSTLRMTVLGAERVGEVAVSYGGAESAGIEWANLTGGNVERAANSIAGVAAAGGVTVEGRTERGKSRLVVRGREVGAITDLTLVSVDESPDMFTRTSTLTAGDATTKEVQLIEAETAALQLFDADDWTAVAATSAAVAVTAGTSASPEVSVISFAVAPAGGEFTVNAGTADTDPISVFASAQVVEDAINDKEASGFNVSKVADWKWEISTTALGDATNLTADDSGVISQVGIYGTLDLSSIIKYGMGIGDTVRCHARLHLAWSDGHAIDIAEDFAIYIDGAPAAGTTTTTTANNVIGIYPATEAISASRFVQIYDASGTDSIRMADASSSQDADGYIESSVASGASITVYGTTGTLAGLSGLTTGATIWLGEDGAPTETEPVAGISQDIGEAVSDGKMSVNIQPAIDL